MHEKNSLSPCWQTSSYGSSADMSGLEQSELGNHFIVCQTLRGRLHYLKGSADTLHGLVSARFITCALVVVALGTVGYLAL
ncbi:hypothetical protein [Candidatus Symbiobacter mobilis]|uniref:Uncharacterized protein n=1 Tax=Candidatus Symbiobacter mobilis CR TaxID=946483 RepID=U5NBA9_9BURK|nr:hypothetical protein [Candidatus Symbiobacter mobilis]AGX87528.1 hypothetical protein Cenrod_1442 [Candidatus Symbiobacter mobilis CR]